MWLIDKILLVSLVAVLLFGLMETATHVKFLVSYSRESRMFSIGVRGAVLFIDKSCRKKPSFPIDSHTAIPSPMKATAIMYQQPKSTF